MAKFIQIALVVVLVAACCAQPARLPKRKQSRLARQEVAPEEEEVPSQTPYPPAGIVPEVPFDLPSEGSSLEPENTYLPPDNTGGVPAQTYGPPDVTEDAEATDVDVSAAEDEPEAEAEAEADQPEEQDQTEEQDAVDEEVDENEVDSQQFGRLVRRRPAKLQARPAKLQVRPAAVAVRSQRLVAQPVAQAFVPQPLIYANGQFFAYNPQLLQG